MAIEVVKITDKGNKKWIRFACPICNYHLVKAVIVGEKREQEFVCIECNAKFIMKWDEADEKLN